MSTVGDPITLISKGSDAHSHVTLNPEILLKTPLNHLVWKGREFLSVCCNAKVLFLALRRIFDPCRPQNEMENRPVLQNSEKIGILPVLFVPTSAKFVDASTNESTPLLTESLI